MSPAMAELAGAAFTGFDRTAMQFWHELAAEMTRDWFVANKQRYEGLWVAPMTALLGEVARQIAPAYKPLALAAPKVMRIYRDVRFSNDKAPYKTHIGAVITVAGKAVGEGGNAAMYIHLGLEEEFVGVGCYRFDAAKLAKWRKAVAGKPGGRAPAAGRPAPQGGLRGRRPRRLQEGADRVRRGSSARRVLEDEGPDRRVPRDPPGLAPQAGLARLAGQAWQGDGAARDLAAPSRRVGAPCAGPSGAALCCAVTVQKRGNAIPAAGICSGRRQQTCHAMSIRRCFIRRVCGGGRP
jgi:uncharacterized protein (DUF2461 family)